MHWRSASELGQKYTTQNYPSQGTPICKFTRPQHKTFATRLSQLKGSGTMLAWATIHNTIRRNDTSNSDPAGQILKTSLVSQSHTHLSLFTCWNVRPFPYRILCGNFNHTVETLQIVCDSSRHAAPSWAYHFMKISRTQETELDAILHSDWTVDSVDMRCAFGSLSDKSLFTVQSSVQLKTNIQECGRNDTDVLRTWLRSVGGHLQRLVKFMYFISCVISSTGPTSKTGSRNLSGSTTSDILSSNCERGWWDQAQWSQRVCIGFERTEFHCDVMVTANCRTCSEATNARTVDAVITGISNDGGHLKCKINEEFDETGKH